jgi:hypothetical protein
MISLTEPHGVLSDSRHTERHLPFCQRGPLHADVKAGFDRPEQFWSAVFLFKVSEKRPISTPGDGLKRLNSLEAHGDCVLCQSPPESNPEHLILKPAGSQ